MNNKTILASLINNKNESEKSVLERLKSTDNVNYHKFVELLKNYDPDDYVAKMYSDITKNIEKYWLNEKYNKNISQSFNMIYFEHDGLYGGELEAYAIYFTYDELGLLKFEIDEDNLRYLENISGHPACDVPILYDLTREIQGKENDFDDRSDIMTLYNLFEATALIEVHKLFSIVDKETIFKGLNIEKP
jgi:hypothetical protein